MTVLFATVLFFGAVSLRFEAIRLQIWLLALAAMVFVSAAAITATLPIEL